MPAQLPDLPQISGYKIPVFDLRGMADPLPGLLDAGRYRMVSWRVVERDPADIYGIGLHQTSILFGVGPQAIQAAGGDEVRAKTLRARKVASHATLFLFGPGDPRLVLANPFRWHVNHGNALNPFTIGLEVEAKLPGQVRQSKPKLSTEQHEAIREALRALVEISRAENLLLTHLWAHRQTNGKKPGDPGEEIWRKGVVEYARPVLKLETELDRSWAGTTKVTPHGRPIPKVWDPLATADYQ